MTTEVIIPEIDILIATSIWLWEKQKVPPFRFSIASGRGLDINNGKEKLLQVWNKAGITGEPQFVNQGPDIIGFNKSEFWQIECKGSGSGKAQTQRNNFDRALASVVSYYNDENFKFTIDDKDIDVQQFLGLALPSTDQYMHLLRDRVKQPLRRCLNLWILLYDWISESIISISPDSDY